LCCDIAGQRLLAGLKSIALCKQDLIARSTLKSKLCPLLAASWVCDVWAIDHSACAVTVMRSPARSAALELSNAPAWIAWRG